MVWTVEAAFEELLSRQGFTSNQFAVARTRVRSIGSFLANTYAIGQEILPYGSYARGTIAAGQRDLDLMALLPSGYWSRFQGDSRPFLYWFRNTLNEHYHATEVSSRQVAVRLDFTQIVTDIAPGFVRKGGGFVIPDGSGGWQATNPPAHGSMIQQEDAAHAGRLRPLIRLMKDWNQANGRRLTSFHIEMMTTAIKRGHEIGTWSAEVATVLFYLPSWIMSGFPDPWQPGTPVDAYLTADRREAAARSAKQDAVRARDAETYRLAGRTSDAFARWSIVYYGKFPAYG
jgi:hypothetical protein